MRTLWMSLAIIFIGFTSASAQQAQVDRQTIQSIMQVFDAYRDSWNKHDSFAIAQLYSMNGILVTDHTSGAKVGRDAIAQYYKETFKRVPNNDAAKINGVVPLGTDVVLSIGEYHLSGPGIKVNGHYTSVNALENGVWKIKMLTATPDAK